MYFPVLLEHCVLGYYEHCRIIQYENYTVKSLPLVSYWRGLVCKLPFQAKIVHNIQWESIGFWYLVYAVVICTCTAFTLSLSLSLPYTHSLDVSSNNTVQTVDSLTAGSVDEIAINLRFGNINEDAFRPVLSFDLPPIVFFGPVITGVSRCLVFASWCCVCPSAISTIFLYR